MSLSLSINKRKALMKCIHYDARKISLLYARILFKRFDKKTFNKYKVSNYVSKFDNKKGKFVDFDWQTKFGNVILTVARTNKNNYYIYQKNIFSSLYYWIKIFILNIFHK